MHVAVSVVWIVQLCIHMYPLTPQIDQPLGKDVGEKNQKKSSQRPLKVARAAKIIAALPKLPRRCGKTAPTKSTFPPLLRAPQEDPWGCPEAVVSKAVSTFEKRTEF